MNNLNRQELDQRKQNVALFLYQVYGHDGDIPQPELAAKIFADQPDFVQRDLMLACATGDVDTLREALKANPDIWRINAGEWFCPRCKIALAMPPLIAITHSTLLQLPEFKDRLLTCARLLLEAGADVNESWEGELGHPLSALYGAAGKNHNAEMTRLLLEAGANPNDNESLYHSMETHDLSCARLLLDHGARVEHTNSLHHCLDSPDLEKLKLLLSYTKDINDPDSGIGNPLLWAIRRGRSKEHIELLLAAGADPNAVNKDGISAFRLAAQSGLTDVANLLQSAGVVGDLTLQEQFVAACARADETDARRILVAHPDIVSTLEEVQLKQLPQMVESFNHDAVRLMVKLGWPIAVRGGDWGASALNHAVYQGNAGLTRFLLEHGASWTEKHDFGDNALGTLSWSSRHMSPLNDYVGCARALLDHGMPIPDLQAELSPAVTAFFNGVREQQSGAQTTNE